MALPMLKSESWRQGKTSAQRGYDHKWQKARAQYLRLHPLCAYCNALGRVTLATVVDHITPHKGDQTLFWDEGNWQPLCAPCHDGAKRQQETTGTLRGCATDGTPLDPNHHWS